MYDNVCPSNEVNSKHEEVNFKFIKKCDLKYTTTSGYLNVLWNYTFSALLQWSF